MSGIYSQKVAALFKSYSNRPFVFIRPGGNFGDQLIFQGAEKLANQHDVSFVSILFEEFNPQDYDAHHIIYIHGSGGFNTLWSQKPVRAFQKALVYHKGVIILGPTTFETNRQFLEQNVKGFISRSLAERIIIVTREWVSFHALRETLPDRVEVDHDHDTALNLDKADLYQGNALKAYTLYAIRNDKERVLFKRRAYFNVWIDPIRIAPDFDSWINMHSVASSIITNRLHSAILGSILGIDTTLLPNNYHKNRGVWEYSLKDSIVRWSDDLPAVENTILLTKNNTFEKTLGNKWIQRVIRRFHGFKSY